MAVAEKSPGNKLQKQKQGPWGLEKGRGQENMPVGRGEGTGVLSRQSLPLTDDAFDRSSQTNLMDFSPAIKCVYHLINVTPKLR